MGGYAEVAAEDQAGGAWLLAEVALLDVPEPDRGRMGRAGEELSG